MKIFSINIKDHVVEVLDKKVRYLSWVEAWQSDILAKKYWKERNTIKSGIKGVIYTCITNGYDDYPKVLAVNPLWDYVLFTDDEKLIAQKISGVWQVKRNPFNELSNVKNSRYVKINNKVLSKYNYSLYIDGNICINSLNVYKKLDEFIEKNVQIAIPYHPSRNCIYTEAEYVKARKIDSSDVIDKEMAFLRSENYPDNNGLFENNLIFRNHKNQSISKAMDLWWHMVSTYSKRDQLSGLYALWKSGVEVTPFYQKRGAHRTCSDFIFVYKKAHNHDKIKPQNQNVRFNFITRNHTDIGSTRIRVYKIAYWLMDHGYEAEINSTKDADICIFQKSNPKFLKPLFVKALKQRKCIVFDIDDYYKRCYDFFIKNASLVIVCSQALKEAYQHLNSNIVVLDGALDVKDENISLKPYNLDNPKLGWFGNVANLEVLEQKQILNVVKITNGGDVEWNFSTVDEDIQKFDLVLLPQNNTLEGKAKGNNRMLKTVYLGVPALVADLDAYVDLAQKINYPKEFILSSADNWPERLEQIKKGKIKFDFDFAKARDIIKRYYSIDVIAQQWLDVVNKVQPKVVNKSYVFMVEAMMLLSRLLKKIVTKNKDKDLRTIVLLSCIKICYRKRK